MRGKKIVATKLPKLEKRRRFGLKIGGKKKKELWQPIKMRTNVLWQWNCRKWEEKKKGIVAMELPKIGGERERERIV